MSLSMATVKLNRLAYERSPYLLQHASNPVDWFPWGNEAFERAKELNRPIFLSVGYSTCHWCHVMENESFENKKIANLLNENFISIKVDREERPDVDKLYMGFIQGISGRGGWPMSVFLTPELEPFTGGTYFPPDDYYGHLGFSSILGMISDKWKNDQSELASKGKKLANIIINSCKSGGISKCEIDPDSAIKTCYKKLSDDFDHINGGFGSAPKFPKPVDLDLLLYFYFVSKNEDALDMVRLTLVKMYEGGMFDHVGKGFHRYSVDSSWHVPHFEKMLYDNAQLLRTYSNFCKTTGGELNFVIDYLIDYLMEDLSHPSGGFFCAEDADSFPDNESKKKSEGAYYVWTKEEIEQVVGDKPTRYDENICLDELICPAYNILENGNVPAIADAHNELTRQNILHLNEKRSLEELAVENKMKIEELMDCLNDGINFLKEYRKKRPKPHLDNKFLTGWNSLAISGLCAAAGTSKDETRREIIIQRAKNAAGFVKSHLTKNDELLRSAYTNEEGHVIQLDKPILAFSDDYANLIAALIDLYEQTFDESYLRWAKDLQTKMDRYFWNEGKGGYFVSRSDDSSIFARQIDEQDTSEPATNSVSALNLLRLSALFGSQDYRIRAENIFSFSAERLKTLSYALPIMCVAIHASRHTPFEFVLVGRIDDSEVKRIVEYLNSKYLPQKTLVLIDLSKPETDQWLARQNASFEGYLSWPLNDQPTLFICHETVCEMPVKTLDQLKERIRF